jgi:hypothetical protein
MTFFVELVGVISSSAAEKMSRGFFSDDRLSVSPGVQLLLQGWQKQLRNDKKFIIEASAKAQRAVDYILNRGSLISSFLWHSPRVKPMVLSACRCATLPQSHPFHTPHPNTLNENATHWPFTMVFIQ